MNYLDFKRYKFSTVFKILVSLQRNFLRIVKNINFKKFTKFFDIKNFKIIKIKKYFDFKNINFSLIKKIKISSSRILILHLPLAIIFFSFLYIFIPTFYNYDESVIEKAICKNIKAECLIKGKIKYRFYPSPRIKIGNVTIKEKKNNLIITEEVLVKLSIKNLLAKENHKFKKIVFNNFEINLIYENLKNYKKIINKKIDFKPIDFNNGKISLFEKKNFVASITNAKIKTTILTKSSSVNLNGKFLGEDIFIEIKNNINEENIFSNLVLKMPGSNFLVKSEFETSKKDKYVSNGNLLVKKDKNKITGIFQYKDDEVTITKSNLRNTFVDGKLEGKIVFLPYFNFDLDIALNSINFTRLYNHFLSFDLEKQKKLFKLNDKFNGKINFLSDKVYSKHNLVKSFESRIKFYNGNAKIEQFLINLGKLGAADLVGTLSNREKYTKFKFESNIFVDNKKKFLSKLGIYNKNINPNLFISGNLDLDNIKMSIYEISDEKKYETEDVNYIEDEFNILMLEDDFENFFDFQKFKVFIKSVADEKN